MSADAVTTILDQPLGRVEKSAIGAGVERNVIVMAKYR